MGKNDGIGLILASTLLVFVGMIGSCIRDKDIGKQAVDRGYAVWTESGWEWVEVEK